MTMIPGYERCKSCNGLGKKMGVGFVKKKCVPCSGKGQIKRLAPIKDTPEIVKMKKEIRETQAKLDEAERIEIEKQEEDDSIEEVVKKKPGRPKRVQD